MTPENLKPEASFETKLVEHVRTSLSEKGIKLATTSSDNVQVLYFGGSKLEITVRIFCGDTYLTLHGTLPITMSKAVLPDLLVYLNSLSATIPIGNYEIHPESRIVAFKVGVLIPPAPTADQLSTLVYLVVESLDSISNRALEFGAK